MFLLNPITYFGSIAPFGDLPGGQAALYRRLIEAVEVACFMPPLAWIADILTAATENGGNRRTEQASDRRCRRQIQQWRCYAG